MKYLCDLIISEIHKMSDEKPINTEEESSGPVKSEKQLKKEAEKAAKLKKLQEKLDKKNTQQATVKPKVEVRLRILIFTH